MTSRSTVILGTGAYAPERVLTNDALSRMVDTSDEWIRARSGIRERRIAAPEEATSDLAVQAARRALEDAGAAAAEIDLLVVATVTPDYPMPATACLVQHKLGVPTDAACFDLNAACSGFIYGLDVACSLIGSGRYKKALVIGAEKLSSIVDWKDRGTCLLFGDGAGAAVVGPSPRPGIGLVGTKLGALGERLTKAAQRMRERYLYVGDDGKVHVEDAVKVTRWADGGILAGSRYRYYVRACSATGQSSVPSNTVMIEPQMPADVLASQSVHGAA